MSVNYIEAVALLLASDQDPTLEENQEIVDARTLVSSKPALQAWYEEERAFYANQEGLLSGFRLSAEAKSRMIQAINEQAGAKPARTKLITFPRLALAAAAAVVLLLGFSTINYMNASKQLIAESGADTLDAFRGFAVSVVDKGFWLDHKSSNQDDLKQWLDRAGAPAGHDLAVDFDSLAAMGCKVMEWNGDKVSLLCFKDGGGQTVHVFVADKIFPSESLAAAALQIGVEGRDTISWQDDHSSYVMVGHDRGQVLDQISI